MILRSTRQIQAGVTHYTLRCKVVGQTVPSGLPYKGGRQNRNKARKTFQSKGVSDAGVSKKVSALCSMFCSIRSQVRCFPYQGR